jgi:hypothetical protein
MQITIDIFHIGPQKTATTWVYQCLREHPQLGCPLQDRIHYYDMCYHRGETWYADHFKHLGTGLKLVDPTYTYFRSGLAAERIHKDFPEAKIIVCLRNPLERAFSHYWHEKKKKRYNFQFTEVLENYDLFKNWIEPGFYGLYLSNYLHYFPRENILCQLFDHLKADPRLFFNELTAFVNVDRGFIPSVLNQKVNAAGPVETPFTRHGKNLVRPLLKKTGLLAHVYRFMDVIRRLQARLTGVSASPKIERLSDQPAGLIKELNLIFRPEIERLEDLLKINLDIWR